MSKRRVRNGADELYSRHLNGSLYNGNYNSNTVDNRVTIMERMYFRILTELAANRFKWNGLPESVNVRYLELTLFYFALSVFYFDERYDRFFALRGGSTNFLNMMDDPTAFVVVGNNFVSQTISAKKAVPIWANYLRVPDIDIVTIYSTKFAELDRTIEINSKNARRTKVIKATENSKLSLVNINRQIDEGQNLIQLAGPLSDLEFIDTIDMGIDPDSLEKLHILKVRLWNECMGLLGIDNANQDKKERLVASEVDANNDQTNMMRYVNLNARRMAAEAINKMYPKLEVSVEYYTDIDKMVQNAAQSLGINED